MSEPEAMLDDYERLQVLGITENSNEENDIDDETMSGKVQFVCSVRLTMPLLFKVMTTPFAIHHLIFQ